jgi:hypothetical protein
MFFEELRNVNNPSEALRITAKRVEPFGILPPTLLTITRKWREAHGLKHVPVWGARKVSQTSQLLEAAGKYFSRRSDGVEKRFVSVKDLIAFLNE